MFRILAALIAALGVSLAAQAQSYPAKAARSADVLERFGRDGTIAVGSTPAKFAEFIQKEQARWGEVVHKSGVRAE